MRVLLAILLLLLSGAADAQTPTVDLHWNPWNQAIFAKARAEHRFVMLDLEAVWCHWCHVMDDVTYRDPQVVRLLNQHYLLVRVDQDSRPDIANRYQDWGWPATIVFAADGSEIVKRRGYIPPKAMASLLQAIVEDPSPGPSVEKEEPFRAAEDSTLAPSLVKRIESAYEMQYDTEAAGWGFGHKYLDRDSVELALRRAAAGDRKDADRVDATLHRAAALIDPEWGGMYQYSVDGRWSEPHFEKIISIQADAMREYSLAYAQTGRAEYLRDAQSIYRYVLSFLRSSGSGAFFVSQDADLDEGRENASYFRLSDTARRALGIPRIDDHVYARENGWMIDALCDYYAASGDRSALVYAEQAAQWVERHRKLQGGGFAHGDHDPAGPYLGDTLAMGEGFLALYNVTGDGHDLTVATAAAHFIRANFSPTGPGTGFVTARTATDAAYKPHPDRDENIALARFTAMLSVANGDPASAVLAREAMRYLASPRIALRPLSAGILLARQDTSEYPLHVTVVGTPSDPAFEALHQAALRTIRSHELLEIRDPAAPRPSPSSIPYPTLNRAALFLCTAQACSAPIFRPEQVRSRIERAETASTSWAGLR